MKKSHKPTPKHLTSQNTINFTLGIVGLVVFIGFLVLTTFVATLWNERNDDFSGVRGHVIAANKNLYKPAIIDAVSKKQFIYEANLVLPVYQTPLQLPAELLYTPELNTETSRIDSITLADKTIFGRAEANLGSDESFFESLPTYQQCPAFAKLVFNTATFSAGDSWEQTAILKLNDGREVTLFRNIGCTSFYEKQAMLDDVDALMQLVANIESY